MTQIIEMTSQIVPEVAEARIRSRFVLIFLPFRYKPKILMNQLE